MGTILVVSPRSIEVTSRDSGFFRNIKTFASYHIRDVVSQLRLLATFSTRSVSHATRQSRLTASGDDLITLVLATTYHTQLALVFATSNSRLGHFLYAMLNDHD